MAKQGKKTQTDAKNNGATLGFEEKLWLAADKLRGSVDAAEYKHVVLGLLFLKYISDAFEDRRKELEALCADPDSDHFTDGDEEATQGILEDRDEYTAANVFWVPVEARWSNIRNNAKQPDIAKRIDDGMYAIEREPENKRLRNVLPRDYARRGIPAERLGELIDLISGIGLGDKESRSKDILGRVYEYFLGKFAAAEGKLGGEFYTPRCVVKLLVEMIEPFQGRVYDPCCGSGGMFVQAERFVEAHEGKATDISVFGQESNPTTWKLAQMNLAIRGIESHLGDRACSSFTNDLHPDLRADFILANPPFNVSDWQADLVANDVRWQYGTPPSGNANYAWIQHMVHHLSPSGRAGFVLANGALSSNQSSELAIRKALIDADLIDCIVYLPPQLFMTTQISTSLWFLARNKARDGLRPRAEETLFIYAYDMGSLVTRTLRELSDTDIERIASTYREWRDPAGRYENTPGFSYSASKEELLWHRHALVPGRYTGFPSDECRPESLSFSDEEYMVLTRRLRQAHSRLRVATGSDAVEGVLHG